MKYIYIYYVNMKYKINKIYVKIHTFISTNLPTYIVLSLI